MQLQSVEEFEPILITSFNRELFLFFFAGGWGARTQNSKYLGDTYPNLIAFAGTSV